MEHLISFLNLPPAVRFLAVGILNLLILLLHRIESLQTQIIIVVCIVDYVGELLLLLLLLLLVDIVIINII